MDTQAAIPSYLPAGTATNHSIGVSSDRSSSVSSESSDDMQNRSRQHFRQSYHEVKYLASGDNGDTYAAISRRDANIILANHHYRKTEAYYDDLRNHLVVVKFSKDNFEENDLEREIMFLTQSIPGQHPSFTACLNYCLNDSQGIQWLVQKFHAGGDLATFLEEFPHASTLGFRWHVVYQLSQALLVLLYGITNPAVQITPAPGWPRVAHNDCFVGNILVQPQGQYANFPDIVLADFGRAEEYPGGDEEDEQQYLEAQVGDVTSIAIVLNDMKRESMRGGDYCECSQCLDGEVILEDCVRRLEAFRTLVEFEGLEEVGRRVVSSGDCVATLKDLIGVAYVQRHRNYRGMPGDALGKLHSPAVSNERLDEAILG